MRVGRPAVPSAMSALLISSKMKIIAGIAFALLTAAICLAQAPNNAKGRGVPRDPAQSPASRPGPKTATAQTYPAEQIKDGELKFNAQCGFCHGRDAAGGETGPDLTRSEVVAEDVHGDKIGPVVRTGRVDQGMPAFKLSDTDLGAIVAYIHDQKTKSESESGGRRSVEPSDLAVGDAAAGERYFNGACARCHSAACWRRTLIA